MVFTPQSVGSLSAGITVTDDALNVAGSTQQVAVSGTAFSGADATSTTVTVAPSALTNGQAASITATVADQTHTSTHPTGSVTFNDTLGTTTTTLSSVSLSSGAATLSGVVLNGIGAHTLSANYAGVSGSYAASSGTVTVVLSKAAVTVSGPDATGSGDLWTIGFSDDHSHRTLYTVAAPTGTISYSILNSSSIASHRGSPALTAGTASSSATIPIPSTLAHGSYTIRVTYGGDANYSVTSTAITIPLSVGQITPASVSLVSGTNPALVTTAVTFTATVTSASGTPTGSVSFFDGTTLLGTVALSNGVASYTTSSLAAATHSITAVYSGSTNSAAGTSSALAELVQDYSLSISGSRWRQRRHFADGGSWRYSYLHSGAWPVQRCNLPGAYHFDVERAASRSNWNPHSEFAAGWFLTHQRDLDHPASAGDGEPRQEARSRIGIYPLSFGDFCCCRLLAECGAPVSGWAGCFRC